MTYLVREGVRLWYEEAGSGDPPILLAHGWCCDHTYLAPQFRHFSASHRVVSVDLRGHGQSDKPEQAYSVEAFADDVVWISSELGLANVVLIGHSLGAAVAVQAASTAPGLVSAVVLLDPAPIIPIQGLPEMIRAFAQDLHAPGYRDAARAHVENTMFRPTDDAALKERIAAEMTAVPQHVMASAMDAIAAWNGERAAADCGVPMLYLSADLSSPWTDLGRLRELCPQLVVGETVGAGHFIQLIVPDQVNDIVGRFLEAHGLHRPVAAGAH